MSEKTMHKIVRVYIRPKGSARYEISVPGRREETSFIGIEEGALMFLVPEGIPPSHHTRAYMIVSRTDSFRLGNYLYVGSFILAGTERTRRYVFEELSQDTTIYASITPSV